MYRISYTFNIYARDIKKWCGDDGASKGGQISKKGKGVGRKPEFLK